MSDILLLGGVLLPSPKPLSPFDFEEGLSRYKKNKLREKYWTDAYNFLLVHLHQWKGEPLHKVFVSMSRDLLREMPYCNNSKAIVLRFLGEMEVAKYVKYVSVKRRFTKSKEREVHFKDKLLKLGIASIEDELKVINYPSLLGNTDYEVRRGNSSQANLDKCEIVRDISKQEFIINDFIYDLLKQVPIDTTNVSISLAFDRTMNSARLFKGEIFNFEYFLDSRGRIYVANTAGFSPQGADHEKALLLHSFKEKLTKSGFSALLEAANGYSELPFTVEEMCNHAKNPLATQEEWKKADKPYCYIACADLIRRYIDNPEEELPSFTPLDGRCSGLQHWTGLLRTNSIVKHIGMHRVEAERDIYERVADDWKETLEPKYKYMATRKVCKVPVMTFPYSATRLTSQENLKDFFGEKNTWNREKEEFEIVEEGLSFEDTLRLGGELYQGLHKTLKDLTVGMKWLERSARIISNNGNTCITWVTPDGFEACQNKIIGKEAVQKVVLSSGKDFEVGYRDFSEKKPASAKHASAISPNIIHSLDVVHLRMVAKRLKESGLPMVFIHDSFSTHSNYRDELYEIIVSTFIELYSGDYLSCLKSYWEDKYGVKLDDLPIRGLFEPNSLKELKLFFK